MYHERFSSSFAWQVTKATLLSVLFAAISTFLFAVLLRFVPASDGAIAIVTAILKGLSVIFGVFFSVREERGLWKGLVSGVLSAMATRLFFCSLCGFFASGYFLCLEIALGGAIGAVCGVIAVGLRR